MIRLLKIVFVVVLVFGAVALVLNLPPVAQDQLYHNFADKRSLCGVANFFDVISNGLFIVFGGMGLYSVFQKRANPLMPVEKWLWAIFFLGAFAVGVGSGYYHLNPNNSTLVWDRIPMTISFMSFFAIVIMHYINVKLAAVLAPLLLAVGIGSVWFWNYTESLGRGDLRPYILVQFLPLIMIPCILWLSPTKKSSARYIWFTLSWYFFAKVLEHFDKELFTLLGHVVSGHSLKHLAAAIGVYTMLLYMQATGPKSSESSSSA